MIEIADKEELIDYIYECIEESAKYKKTIKDILSESGVIDTVNILDKRTKQLLELYELFGKDPKSLDYGIFANTVLILNPIYKVNNYGW